MNDVAGQDDFRDRLRHGQKPLIGLFLTLGSSAAAEACAHTGVDWLLVDLEHGCGSEADLLPQLQAISTAGVYSIVRVEQTSGIRVGRALDMGTMGVMFPRVDSAVDAQRVVRHTRFPPVGDRGVALSVRSQRFGLEANAGPGASFGPVSIVQIETANAVKEADDIASLPGVDALFIGPTDLSYALGVPGDQEHPLMRAAVEHVVKAARRAHIGAGIFTSSIDRVADYRAQGFNLLAIGSDAAILTHTIRHAVRGVDGRSAV